MEPGAAGVMATAVEIGSGGWVRYQVTISNVGDLDWTGDVRLVSRQPPIAPAPPGSQKLPVVSLPIPLPIGQGQIPATAPDAALQAHLAVGSRQQRVVYLSGLDHYTMVEVLNRNGQAVYGAPIEVSNAVPVAVLSDVDTTPSALATVHIGDLPIKVLSFSHAADFPSSLVQLGSFAAVVVDQFDLATLSRSQLNGLRDYVGLGGSIVVAGGSSWRRTMLPLPADLSPLKPTAMITESLQQLGLLNATDAATTAPVTTGTLAPGAKVVISGQPAPLMLELAFGAGRVVALTYDPAAQPVQGTRLADTSWTEALGRVVIKARAAQTWTPSTIPGPSLSAASALPQPPENPLPPPWLLGFGLLVYLLVIGPINLALSRRMGKPDLPWITIPVLAVSSVIALYFLGGLVQGGTRDVELQVVRVGPDGSVAQMEYHQLLFNQRGQHTIESNAPTLLAPMTLGVFQVTNETCQACAAPFRGLPQSVGEHVVSGAHPKVVEDGVAYGNVRVVSAASGGHATMGLDAKLSVVQGRVQGTIANLSSSDVAGVALYTYDGETFRRTDLVGTLAPGEQADVSAQPKAVSGGGNGSGTQPAGSLVDLVARGALAANPQPILMAFVQPLTSHLSVDGRLPATASAALMEQPVRIQSADTMLRDWTEVRILGAAGDQRAGFTSVYDIDVPAPSSLPLQLSFDGRQHGSVDVYDWRSGAWRSGPWVTDPQNGVNRIGALSPDEISSGTVRVRIKEPRLTWGAFIEVQPAR